MKIAALESALTGALHAGDRQADELIRLSRVNARQGRALWRAFNLLKQGRYDEAIVALEVECPELRDRKEHMMKRTKIERIKMNIRLAANAAETRAWFEALGRVNDRDSPAANAIRAHIKALVDEQARIMGLSKDEIARINAEAEWAVEAQIEAEISAHSVSPEGSMTGPSGCSSDGNEHKQPNQGIKR
jgi:hypothetical protein